MAIKKRIVMQKSRLPSEYTELEYLQTGGNCAIDTNIMISGNEKWECVFQVGGSSILSSAILGTLNGGSIFTNPNNFSITYTTAVAPGSYAVYIDGNAGDASHSWNGGLLSDHTIQTIKYKGLNIAPTINDVTMTQITPTTLTPITASVGVRLFGRATTSGNGAYSQAGVRIYSFKGDTWNFIPCKRNSDNVLGMYELVSNTFCPKTAGTGTFTAGDVAPTKFSTICTATYTEYVGGIVDMGTLNWYPIGNGLFYCAITGKANGRNIYCSKYPTDQTSMASSTANMHIGGHDGNRVYFRNTSLESTKEAAQADLNGIMLYYQRTTDTSWSPPSVVKKDALIYTSEV